MASREKVIVLSEIELLVKDLKKYLYLAVRKPYISYWGELFYILYKIKKLVNEPGRYITLYDIYPVGTIDYDANSRLFIAKLPELLIKLQDINLVDALLKGSFKPITQEMFGCKQDKS